MDIQAALIAAVGGLTAALGVMWLAFQKQIAEGKAACEEDRRKLWELIRIVSQLERRRDSPLFNAAAPMTDDEIHQR